MRTINKLILGACALFFGFGATAQVGLDSVIVETYYVADANDAADEDGGGTDVLPLGSVTYRVYVDMAPGWKLETVYGNSDHDLKIETTTNFWNNNDRGETFGDQLPFNRMDENTVALDSYLSFGGASDEPHVGVLKTEDNDGSDIGGVNNDGGSNGVAGGLLVNNDPLAGIPLTTADGLLPGVGGATNTIGIPTAALDIWADDTYTGPSFVLNGGGWFVLGGRVGDGANNRILIAQITTDGNLSFELNVRVSDAAGNTEDWVAVNPLPGEFTAPTLTFPVVSLPPDCNGVPGGPDVPGASCDDGDPTTGNDVYQPDCTCAGELIDCEGVPGGTDLPGASCDDGDPTTGNDVYQADCTCAGELIDCEGVPGGTDLPGASCDDGDPTTGNDVYQADCTCAGELIDCEGVPGGTDLPGASCDDGDPTTGNDVYQADCTCAGELIDCEGVPGGTDLPGQPCDDGDPNTGGDVYQADCTCAGAAVDCNGVPGGPDVPGASCDDGDQTTGNDVYQADCTCAGQLIDCEGVPGGTDLPGASCDDGDPTTGNDVYQADCTCAGELIDCEGVPGGTDLPGQPCDDGDPNTSGDVYQADCTCAGATVDCNGVPGGSDVPGAPCDDGDPSTGNDVYQADCTCAGQTIDCLGVPGGSALPGTPCDDGDPNTTGDVYQADCTCSGMAGADCNGVPGGTASIDACGVCSGGNTGIAPNSTCLDCFGVVNGPDTVGAACDDGNPFTTGDVYQSDCTCAGTINNTACDGQPGGLEGVIVETYYVADANDAADTDGAGNLTAGATTYRIFIDLAAGYNLESMFGNAAHTLSMSTSTIFFNQTDRGEQFGDAIDAGRLDENTLGIDSWLSMGGASDAHNAVLKSVDVDGSIVGGANNDGGSNAVAGGLLKNDSASVGIPLTTADGLEAGVPATTQSIGIANFDAFLDNSTSTFLTNGGSWFVLGGTTGPTADNRVLVAQVTTNGDFDFELNLRIGTPTGGFEDWVASSPAAGERTCAELTFSAAACPAPGTACDDGDPATTADVEDGFCNCAGTPITGGNNALQVVINADDNGNETSWEIVNAGTNNIVCSGANYPSNTTTIETCIVTDGCYELRFFDSMGDGMFTGAMGGYSLLDQNGNAIIENGTDGQFGATSAIINNNSFCVPIGTDALRASDCGRLDLEANDFIIAAANPAVTAEFGIGDQTDDGFRFWLYDPDGTYSRRIFRSHANPTPGSPPGAYAVNHLRLSSIYTLPVPQNVELNVRIQSVVNGVASEYGPACPIKIDPVAAACPLTKLIDDTNSQYFSCGVQRLWNAGQFVVAKPVPGANRYQFRYTDNNGYVRSIAYSGYISTLSWGTLPLVPGTTYDVTVRASFDNGATYCPFGEICTVEIVEPAPAVSANRFATNVEKPEFKLYPNPTRGEQVFVNLSGLSTELEVATVSVTDMFGKQVSAEQVTVGGSEFNYVLDISSDMASGMYLVSVQIGEEMYIERLMVQ